MRSYLEGLAFWAPTLPGWEAARAAFRGQGAPLGAPVAKPSARLLAPVERRRAPDSVALALEVAQAAVAASGRSAVDLPCVFASAHGDFAIIDAMCHTLADAPRLVSPTRFHNSVQNAAAGYWTIATGCRQASTSISGSTHTFASALLEAAVQCAADERAVLLVGFDVATVGPLQALHASHGLLAGAMVLAPQRGERTAAAIDWRLLPRPSARPLPRSAAARTLPANGMSEMLPVFEALACLPERDAGAALHLPLGPQLTLALALDGGAA